VLDDSTVTVRYGNAYATGTITWEVCFPKHLLEHLDPKKVTEWDFWTRPVGNGPYRFTRYMPETLMEFEANPDYYRGKPRIERVVLRFVPDAGLAELLSGNVDVFTATSPAHIPKLAADPRFRAYHDFGGIGGAVYTIFWQNAHPLFRDPRVRQALTLAINRREIIRLLNLPESAPVIDGPYTDRQLRRGGLPEPLPYDPRQAGALLDAAGYRDRDGDGVREREGKPFRFAALVSSRPEWSVIAVYVQEQLRRVGVLMDIRTLDQGSARRALATGKFEAVLNFTGWSPNALRPLFGENSFIGYNNVAVATLLRRLALAMDPAEEDRLRRELAEIFRAEVPATFLFRRVNTVLAHRRIRGLGTPWRADPIRFMGDLWLEDENQK
jgi:peptide/nickel transport system substrate-binding protein